MKKYTKLLLIMFGLIFLLNPVFKIKADTPEPPKQIEYKFLAPLPNPNGTIEPVFTVNNDSLTKYLNMIIKFTIGVAGVLAVIMIVMGGIQYMGNELISSKEAGKSQMFNALFGLLITLSAYAILNTINPSLLKADPSKSMTQVIVDIQDNTPQMPGAGGKYSDGRVYGEVLPLSLRAALPSGVTINNGGVECATVGQQMCTSTVGLNVDKLSTIKSNCGCSLLITGGTETWLHGVGTTHGVGSGTVDLHASTELTKYFTGSTATPNQDWYRTKDGGWALYEVHDGVTHWHYNPTDKK